MNRRLLVLKMLVLAIEEIAMRGQIPMQKEIEDLALVYGKGIDLEQFEIRDFFSVPVVEAIKVIPVE